MKPNHIFFNMQLYPRAIICNLIVAITATVLFTSCSNSLSKDELSIINTNLPAQIFEEQVKSAASELNDYLWEGIREYADKTDDELTTAIYNKHQAVRALGWENDIFGQAFLGDKTEKNAALFEKYIDYANSHQTALADQIESIAKVIIKNPSVISKFNNGDVEEALAPFRSLEGMHSDLNIDMVAGLENMTLDETDQVEWGAAVMGEYNKPCLSAPNVLFAMLRAVKDCAMPKPVYAFYDDDQELWIIGYDNKDAYEITFTKKGDVIQYEYSPTEYSTAYENSRYNVLK